MEQVTALKLAEIMTTAAAMLKTEDCFDFTTCVGVSFWKSFGKYEQSQLMQDVYITLCDMGFTPLESHQ